MGEEQGEGELDQLSPSLTPSRQGRENYDEFYSKPLLQATGQFFLKKLGIPG
jgi:hypothetical protein